MDISKIDMHLIELFSFIDTIAEDIFGVEPIAASAKMQKKIRKWIEKNDFSGQTYPEEVMQYIGEEVNNEDFFRFLKACHDQIQLNCAHKKQWFDQSSADLTEEVKNTIWELLEQEIYCSNIRKTGTDAEIDVEYHVGYVRTLTLINASCIPEGKIDCLSFRNGSLMKQDDGYSLTGEAENYEEDSSTPFAIRFTDAKVDINLFRADEQQFGETPWVYLQDVAGEILYKYILPGESLNDKEKEFLPLIAEISKLSNLAYIPEEFESADFSQMKSYLIKFGYNELLPLVENLEQNYFNGNKKGKIIRKLVSKLNNQKYEPLWRELNNILLESQSQYLSKAAVYCPTELLHETRSKIQKFMESNGYSGQYPDFSKKGAIRGIRLAESYDMSYLIGAERNVMYYIHCTEEYLNDNLTIQFICGTEILRKNETPGDIYSCLFNAKGRRLFQTISYEIDCFNRDGEGQTDHWEQRVRIAVKKAELIKLTKEERKEIIGFDVPYWSVFFGVFIVMGVLFGILMTIGLMLVAVAACFVLAQPQAIPSMLTEIPWWAFFLLAWVLFGGAMGIVTVLSKRK